MLGRGVGMVLVAAAVLAGCGSGGGKPVSGLAQGQRAALVAQLEAVRATAAGGDLAATEAAIHRFRADVIRLRRTGALSAPAARELRVGASRLLARAKSDMPPPQPAVTTPAPAPVPHPPGKAKGHKDKGPKGHKDKGPKGHGHGKGKD